MLTLMFCLTCTGANVASLLLLPRNCVSLGASGAVFGLFTLSVLIKLAAGFNVKKFIEAVILGQFVLSQLQQEVRSKGELLGSRHRRRGIRGLLI